MGGAEDFTQLLRFNTIILAHHMLETEYYCLRANFTAHDNEFRGNYTVAHGIPVTGEHLQRASWSIFRRFVNIVRKNKCLEITEKS